MKTAPLRSAASYFIELPTQLLLFDAFMKLPIKTHKLELELRACNAPAEDLRAAPRTMLLSSQLIALAAGI